MKKWILSFLCMAMSMAIMAAQPQISRAQLGKSACKCNLNHDQLAGAKSLHQFLQENNMSLADNKVTSNAPNRMPVNVVNVVKKIGYMLVDMEAYEYEWDDEFAYVYDDPIPIGGWLSSRIAQSEDSTSLVFADFYEQMELHLIDNQDGTVTVETGPMDSTQTMSRSGMYLYETVTVTYVIPELFMTEGAWNDIMADVLEDGSLYIGDGFTFFREEITTVKNYRTHALISTDTVFYSVSPILRNCYLLNPNGFHTYKVGNLNDDQGGSSGGDTPTGNEGNTDNTGTPRIPNICVQDLINSSDGGDNHTHGGGKNPFPIKPSSVGGGTEPRVRNDNGSLFMPSNTGMTGLGNLLPGGGLDSDHSKRTDYLSSIKGGGRKQPQPIKPVGSGNGDDDDYGTHIRGNGNLPFSNNYSDAGNDNDGQTLGVKPGNFDDWDLTEHTSDLSTFGRGGEKYPYGGGRNGKPIKPGNSGGKNNPKVRGVDDQPTPDPQDPYVMDSGDNDGQTFGVNLGNGYNVINAVLDDDFTMEPLGGGRNQLPIKPGAGNLTPVGNHNLRILPPSPPTGGVILHTAASDSVQIAPVYIYQVNDSIVYVYGLYGRFDDASQSYSMYKNEQNEMYLNPDGTMTFPSQRVGYSYASLLEDKNVWNYSAEVGNGEFTDLEPGNTGTWTPEAISWGNTVLKTMSSTTDYYYYDNQLFFADGRQFGGMTEPITITTVTQMINDVLNGGTSLTIDDVTRAINTLLCQ